MREYKWFKYCWVLIVLFLSCHKIELVQADNPVEQDDVITTNKVVVWGHSAGVIIEPFIKEYMEEALDIDIDFEACSVNGECMLQVAARQGSIPAYFISEDCQQTNDGYIVARLESPLKSLFNNEGISFSIVNGFNPCSINGVKGYLLYDRGNYIFKPTSQEGLAFTEKNLILSFASSEFKNALATFLWCDQTIDKQNLTDFIQKYKTMAEYVGNDNFYIMGAIVGTDATRDPIEALLKDAFGNHFFNGRKYLLSEAILESSLTESDRACIERGQLPSFYMKDTLHLNEKAARLISKKMVEIILSTPSVQKAILYFHS